MERQNCLDAERREGCLTEEEALRFALQELPDEEEMRVAEHLADCGACLVLVRAASFLAEWTVRLHAHASRAHHEDWVAAAAAAAPQSREPVEIETSSKRFSVALCPEEGGSRWLLVVKPNFPCPDGAEIIVRSPQEVLRLPVVGGRARAVLQKRLDLNGVHISSCGTAEEGQQPEGS